MVPILVAAFALLIFSVSGVQAETVLRTRLASDILSLDPGTLRDDNTDAVEMHMIEGLIASREDGSIGPMLASSWTISPDGKTYTFLLRHDVHFHNGAPLTSAEVVWSFRRYLKPETHWRCRDDLNPAGMTEITKIDAPDMFTVVLHLSKAAPLFLKTIARAECGGTGILHPDSVDRDGKFHVPIGTGPFMFGAWKHNQFIELNRFPQYSSLPGPRDGNCGGKHALVDKIRFLIIPDASAARIALLRGSLDVLDNMAASDISSVKGNPAVRISLTQAMDSYVLLIETKDPVLADIKLRQALAMCIDIVGLTRVVTFATAKPDSSPIPNVSPFHGPVESQLRRPDLAAARKLVQKSSYRGQPIRILANHRMPQMFDAAVLIQAMAAEIGIYIEIETLDWAAQMSRYTTGDYQIMAFSFSARLDPTFSFAVLIGDKTTEPRKVWDTPEARQLLSASSETADPAQRQAIFDRLEHQFRDYVPAVEFYNSSRVAAVRSNVVGFSGWPSNQTRLWDVGFATGAD
jgi:peptide/nickel transport system substrate-binding protein